MSPVPTVDDLLQATHIGNGFHHWHVEGGVITIARAQLILALEAAYDPSMENWPALVEAEINNLLWSSINA
jgi:hypothetical protein